MFTGQRLSVKSGILKSLLSVQIKLNVPFSLKELNVRLLCSPANEPDTTYTAPFIHGILNCLHCFCCEARNKNKEFIDELFQPIHLHGVKIKS